MKVSLRRAAVAVRERKAQRRPPDAAALMSALPVPLVVFDAENRFTFANHAAEQFLGVSAVQLDQMHPDRPGAGPQPGVRADRPGPPRRCHRVRPRHDLRKPAPAQNRHHRQGAPLTEEPGSVLLLMQDASAARALDRQLNFRSAARSVTGMAAILAHEVKNPLSGIRGAAQLLEASVSDADRELTVLIRDEADRSAAWRPRRRSARSRSSAGL